MDRCRARFEQEAIDVLFVLRHLAAEDLHGDALVDDRVAGRVDDAHAALTEHALDAVAAVDGLSQVRVFAVPRRGHDLTLRRVEAAKRPSAPGCGGLGSSRLERPFGPGRTEQGRWFDKGPRRDATPHPGKSW